MKKVPNRSKCSPIRQKVGWGLTLSLAIGLWRPRWWITWVCQTKANSRLLRSRRKRMRSYAKSPEMGWWLIEKAQPHWSGSDASSTCSLDSLPSFIPPSSIPELATALSSPLPFLETSNSQQFPPWHKHRLNCCCRCRNVLPQPMSFSCRPQTPQLTATTFNNCMKFLSSTTIQPLWMCSLPNPSTRSRSWMGTCSPWRPCL